MVDFAAVPGLDFSTVSALCRFAVAAHRAGCQVVASAAPELLGRELRRNLPPHVFGNLLFVLDADRALEHCEDGLIADYDSGECAGSEEPRLLDLVGADMARHLDRQALFEDLIRDLRAWLDVREYAAGETLPSDDESGDVVRLITAGRASILSADGERLRQLGPGDALGPRVPLGTTAAAAAVVTDEPVSTATLTASGLRRLEEGESELALRLYRFLLGTEAQTTD